MKYVRLRMLSLLFVSPFLMIGVACKSVPPKTAPPTGVGAAFAPQGPSPEAVREERTKELSEEEKAEFEAWVKANRPEGNVIPLHEESEGEKLARLARESAESERQAQLLAEGPKTESVEASAPPATPTGAAPETGPRVATGPVLSPVEGEVALEVPPEGEAIPPEVLAPMLVPEAETPPEAPGPGQNLVVQTPEGNQKVRELNGMVTLFYHLRYQGGPQANVVYKEQEVINLQIEKTRVPLQESSIYKLVMSRLDSQAAPPEMCQVFPERDMLVITASPQKVEEIEKLLIEVLDTPQPQVEIEAQVVERIESEEFQLGWNVVFQRKTGADTYLDTFRLNFPPQDFFDLLVLGQPARFRGPTVTVSTPPGHGGSVSLTEATIRAFVDADYAQIVSQPRLTVKVGQTARITNTVKVAVVNTFNFATFTATQVVFKDVGVKLYITPLNVSRDMVTLHIVPEVSNVIGYSEVAPGFPAQPNIQSRFAETTLTVADGTQLVIAGLDSDEEVKREIKVPFFGDIPVVGYLFKSIETFKRKKRLIFLIRPTIAPAPMVLPE